MDPNPIQPPQFQPSPAPAPSLSSKPDKDIPIYILVILFVMILGSLFLFRYVLQKSTNRPVNTTNINQEPRTKNQEPTAPPSLTPTPTPLQGPGPYSCSFLGACKNWGPQIQKENCTVTFADKDCLGQCGDTTKRCKF